MLNQVILVGRLVYDPQLKKLDDGTSVTTVTLAIQRGYKNAESGEYETDFLKITLWRGVAENTVAYCKKGSIVGVKARLQPRMHECKDGLSFSYPEIIAEKITFISSKKEER